MNESIKNIVIIGAGMIGTALGNQLASKGKYVVTLLTIEEHVANSINNSGYNSHYFPNLKLNDTLRATTDPSILSTADIMFIAIPSVAAVDYLHEHKDLIKRNSTIVNLAKGFGRGSKTITSCLEEFLPNRICSLKGPTFAREIINGVPTAFTFATSDPGYFQGFADIFQDTNIYLDFTTDVTGIEILSILKNIYAIALGIVDAHFDSPNLRFLILTRAFNEMRKIHLVLGGEEDTLFTYSGYGDFSLTALNDLSRNRTLGLLIGKSFFIEDISDKVVLEGKIAAGVFLEHLSEINHMERDFPVLCELQQVFSSNYTIANFVNRLLEKFGTGIQIETINTGIKQK